MAPKNLLIFFCWVICARGHEFYSSTDQMASLIAKEEELLENFSEYIIMEAAYLLELNSVLLELILYNSRRPDLEMTDPLAAYKLMRRLRDKWEMISECIKTSPSQVYQELLNKELQELPDQDDMDGAAYGIIQLQEMYKLYPQNITTDPLTGETVHLNLMQSFHLGKVAYIHGSYQHAFLWFQQCLAKLNEEEEEDKVEEDADVLKYMVFKYLILSASKFGNMPFAINYTQQIINLDPTNLEARLDLAIYKSKHSQHTPSPDILKLDETSGSLYEALCRGEAVKMTSRKKRPLSCRYSTVGGNPRLMYAPVKVEEEWDEPQIVRYHDVISKSEIELLKDLSEPRLGRSRTTSDEEMGKVSYYRVSQSAALSEDDDPVVSRITQRLFDMTGMDMESGDLLEVINYGIGGQFGPHYDTGDQDESSGGQRIATILIYLSDVSIGGSTAFPLIGASIKPQEGTAVMWYNLLRNGELDEQSKHAGCPVFKGSKWIATKWVRERGQEFRRRCALSENE